VFCFFATANDTRPQGILTLIPRALALTKVRTNIQLNANGHYIAKGATPVTEFLKELWDFMKERRKFWLFPFIAVLLLFGALIVLTEGSAVAPFIYTLF